METSVLRHGSQPHSSHPLGPCAHSPAPQPPTLYSALEKALEARKRERQLLRFRESKGVADYGGPELGYAAELQARRARSAVTRGLAVPLGPVAPMPAALGDPPGGCLKEC